MADNYGKSGTVQKFEIAAPNQNLAFASVTKFAADRSKTALVWKTVAGEHKTFSFFEIERFSNRIANVLSDRGIVPCDRVFALMNRAPELYAAVPAVLKTGASFGVLFSDFAAGNAEGNRVCQRFGENQIGKNPARDFTSKRRIRRKVWFFD